MTPHVKDPTLPSPAVPGGAMAPTKATRTETLARVAVQDLARRTVSTPVSRYSTNAFCCLLMTDRMDTALRFAWHLSARTKAPNRTATTLFDAAARRLAQLEDLQQASATQISVGRNTLARLKRAVNGGWSNR